MTLPTSSDARIMRHDIFVSIKQNLWLLICGLSVLGIMIPWFTFASGIYGANKDYPSIAYRLISNSRVTNATTFSFVIIVFAVACAGFQFIFAFNRKAVNVYFSIGLTRTKLFVSRCIGGAVMLFVIVLVPMLIDLFINISALGASAPMISAWFYLTFGFLVLGLVAFFVTACACAAVGTVLEGVAFSFGLLAAPTMLYEGFGRLMSLLLFGCNIGKYTNYNRTAGLASGTRLFNPIAFFYKDIDIYSAAYTENNTLISYSSKSPLPGFNIAALLAWLLIAAGLAVGAYFIFKNRRTEIAGRAGACRALNLTAQFVIAFLIFCEVARLLKNSINTGMALAFIIAAVFFVVSFYLVGCIIRRGFKGSVKELKIMPVFLVAAFIPVIILASGGFGYTSRIPAASDVVQAVFSYTNNQNYVPSYGAEYSSGESGIDCKVKFTTRKDIDAVIAAHKAIIEGGCRGYSKNDPRFTDNTAVSTDIRITYTLKGGRKFERIYDRTTIGALRKMQELDRTDAIKGLEAAYITGKSVKKYIEYKRYYSYTLDSRYNNFCSGKLFVSDNCFVSAHKVGLSKALRRKLLSCISKDVTAQPLSDRYYSQKSSLGMLIFESNDKGNDFYDTLGWGENNVVFVTDRFKNTIAFLKQNGLYKYFSAPRTVESIDFEPYNKAVSYYDGSIAVPYFTSSVNTWSVDKNDKTFSGRITDGAKISLLVQKLLDNRFAKDGGYIARIKIKGEKGFLYKYLPYGKASSEIIANINR